MQALKAIIFRSSFQRTGGSVGSVSADYILVPATADDSDLSAVSGNLIWADGDSSDKTITVATGINSDSGAGLEKLLFKLMAPSGGATLAAPAVSSVYISDGNSTEIEFDRATVETSERGYARAIVVVQRRENASGAASVDFSISGGDAVAGADFQGAANGTLSWADGDADPKSLEFTIVDDGSGESDETFNVILSNPIGATLGAVDTVQVVILDGAGANQAPNAQAGSSQDGSAGRCRDAQWRCL